jgi:hypothetical protein
MLSESTDVTVFMICDQCQQSHMGPVIETPGSVTKRGKLPTQQARYVGEQEGTEGIQNLGTAVAWTSLCPPFYFSFGR